MGERYLERIVASGIKIGTIQTLKALGLLPEVVTISQAEKIYGRRLITEWRSKEWIKFYPAKNKERGKYYVKMSELETASAMMDIHNKVPMWTTPLLPEWLYANWNAIIRCLLMSI